MHFAVTPHNCLIPLFIYANSLFLKLCNQSFSDLEKYEECSANKIANKTFKGGKWHFLRQFFSVCDVVRVSRMGLPNRKQY